MHKYDHYSIVDKTRISLAQAGKISLYGSDEKKNECFCLYILLSVSETEWSTCELSFYTQGEILKI